MAHASLTIDAAVVRSNFNALVELGVAPGILEAILGSHRDEMQRLDGRLPFMLNLQLIKKGIEIAGETVPLHLGSSFTPERLGVWGYILQNCRNLEDAAPLFLRYQQLLYAISTFKVAFKGQRWILGHTITKPAYRHFRRISAELNLTAILQTLRLLLNQSIVPLEVHFSYPKPRTYAEYVEIFQCLIRFDQTHDALMFHRDVLAKKIPHAQAYVKQVMITHAEELMRNLEQNSTLGNRIRGLALELMPRGVFDIDFASERLNMSRWSLTRKLKAEGLTFRNQMITIRKDLAVDYLTNSGLSITDITFMLGYSQESAFSRAFKQWTGQNPSEYRRTHKGKDNAIDRRGEKS